MQIYFLCSFLVFHYKNNHLKEWSLIAILDNHNFRRWNLIFSHGLWKRALFHRNESLTTQCLGGKLRGNPQEAKASQGHQSWQLSSGRNPLVFTVSEGMNQISVRGSSWKRRATSLRKESLTTQCLIDNWKAARSPRPTGAVISDCFHREQSKNVCNFRSQNPTFSPGCLGRNDGSFPQEGKPSITASHRQVRKAPQETKANPSCWNRQLSPGRNPRRFPILGGRIPFLAIGTWLWTMALFPRKEIPATQGLMGSWEVAPWSPRPARATNPLYRWLG